MNRPRRIGAALLALTLLASACSGGTEEDAELDEFLNRATPTVEVSPTTTPTPMPVVTIDDLALVAVAGLDPDEGMAEARRDSLLECLVDVAASDETTVPDLLTEMRGLSRGVGLSENAATLVADCWFEDDIAASLIDDAIAAGATIDDDTAACIEELTGAPDTKQRIIDALQADGTNPVPGDLGVAISGCLGNGVVAALLDSVGFAVTEAEAACLVDVLARPGVDLTADRPPTDVIDAFLNECLSEETAVALVNVGLPEAVAMDGDEARCFLAASALLPGGDEPGYVAGIAECGVLGRIAFSSLGVAEAISATTIACVDTAATAAPPESQPELGVLFEACATTDELETFARLF